MTSSRAATLAALEPTAIITITAPAGGPAERPIWFVGAVSFGVVSLLVATVVVVYAWSG